MSILPLLAALLIACAAPTASTLESSPAPALAPARETLLPDPVVPAPNSSTPSPLPPATEASALPLPEPRYSLDAILNYSLHHLAVEEIITYTNRTGQPLADLLLVVEPAIYPGVFQLNRLALYGSSAIEAAEWTEINHLRLPLPQPLEAGEAIRLDLSYELALPSPVPSPDVRPIPFGYTSRQANLVDWYPFIPPYLPGQGWLAHTPGYYGEHLTYESADFEVEINLEDQPGDLVVAASAAAEQGNGGRRYVHENARNFAWSVSPDYEVISQTVETTTIYSYAFPYDAQASQGALHTTAQALELYSRLYGAYPRPTLSVVEADFLDGMEFDGLYFLSKGFYNLYTDTPGQYLVAIAAHETCHQWFYGAIGNDQALEPWLDEALSTYCERIYYENFYPEALDGWWWPYRINYDSPAGWVNTSIYNPQGDAHPYRAYRSAAYFNGARFLEELRTLVGDQAFFNFLHAYVAQFTGQIVQAQDFFDLLSKYTSVDLSPLLSQYFSGTALK